MWNARTVSEIHSELSDFFLWSHEHTRQTHGQATRTLPRESGTASFPGEELKQAAAPQQHGSVVLCALVNAAVFIIAPDARRSEENL